MYWELTDPGLAETASLGHYEYLGAGMFYTWLACEPDSVEENLDRLRRILLEVERDGVTAEELNQAKNKVKARVVLGSERPQSRLFNVGGNWLQRREYRTVADDLKSLDDVTVEQIRTVLTKYPLTNASTITVGPRESVREPK
jgi:predicted Zn-dependent peptidase